MIRFTFALAVVAMVTTPTMAANRYHDAKAGLTNGI